MLTPQQAAQRGPRVSQPQSPCVRVLTRCRVHRGRTSCRTAGLDRTVDHPQRAGCPGDWLLTCCTLSSSVSLTWCQLVRAEAPNPVIPQMRLACCSFATSCWPCFILYAATAVRALQGQPGSSRCAGPALTYQFCKRRVGQGKSLCVLVIAPFRSPREVSPRSVVRLIELT